MPPDAAGNTGDVGATNGAAAAVATTQATATTATEPWSKSIEDADLRGWTELKGWKSPADAAKSARELESKLGAPAERLLKLPDANAKPEEWNAFYERVGRPADANGYELKVPDGDNGDFAKAIAPILHEAGITKAQAGLLNEKWNSLMEGMVTQANEAKASKQGAELADLKREWSGKTYDERTELGRRAMREYGSVLGGTAEERQQMLTAIEDTIGTARLLKLFAAIGEKQGEHGWVEGDRSKGTFGMTAEAATVKKSQLMADSDFAKKFMAGKDSAEFQQIEELNKIILGNG